MLEHQCQLCLPLSILGSDLKVNVFVLKHILNVNFVKEKLLKTNRAYITKLYLAYSIAIVNVAWVERERVSSRPISPKSGKSLNSTTNKHHVTSCINIHLYIYRPRGLLANATSHAVLIRSVLNRVLCLLIYCLIPILTIQQQ